MPSRSSRTSTSACGRASPGPIQPASASVPGPTRCPSQRHGRRASSTPRLRCRSQARSGFEPTSRAQRRMSRSRSPSTTSWLVPPTPTGAPASPGSDGDPRIFAAGDIASCNVASDEGTAWLLDGVEGLIMPLGDLAYESGSKEEFDVCYEPNWGRHKGRTRPVPGNHEYRTPGASGYFDYFGSLAGDRALGYYSFDVGDWHIVALNSNCDDVGVRARLAAGAVAPRRPAECRSQMHACGHARAAIFLGRARKHRQGHPAVGRDVRGWSGRGPVRARPRLRALPAAGSVRQPGPPFGIPQFVVGTGGRSLVGFDGPPLPGTAIRDASAFGVLELALRAGRFDWRFLSTGGPLADAGLSPATGRRPNSA